MRFPHFRQPSDNQSIYTIWGINHMKGFEKPVYVTRPFLPPLPEFYKGLEDIWTHKWLTNYGPTVQRFETRLAELLATNNICIFTNGTLALQLGLQGLELSGEVITTPFTFVATSHALYWNKIRPVFCDIEPDFFTIDPDRIEELITPWTTGILAVHVFGHPCRLERLAQIAKKHKLALIYDAAHAFSVKVGGKSIAHFGDLSMFSFHATKFFHTCEGGMLVFKEALLKTKFNYLKNFGFKNETEVVMPGTNAKMDEIQALMGILMLDYIEQMIEKRRQITSVYHERLSGKPGIRFCPKFSTDIEYNYGYVPVQIFESEFGLSRDLLYETLKTYNIFTRRYFFPLIPDFATYKSISTPDPLTTARHVSDHIINLPIYYDLSLDDVHRICDIIEHIQQTHAGKGKKTS